MLGIVSLKAVGSYLADAVRRSHLSADFICAYENSSSHRAEEAKQVEIIKTKIKELFTGSKYTIEMPESGEEALTLAHSLGGAVIRVNLYFQNIFSEESYISLEHWKNLSKELPHFELKHRALLKLLRMWR